MVVLIILYILFNTFNVTNILLRHYNYNFKFKYNPKVINKLIKVEILEFKIKELLIVILWYMIVKFLINFQLTTFLF